MPELPAVEAEEEDVTRAMPDRCRQCGGPDGAFGIRWPGGTFSVARDCRTFDDARVWAMSCFPGSRVEKDGRMWLPQRGKFCKQDGTVTQITRIRLVGPENRTNSQPLCANCRATRKQSQKSLDGPKA